MRKGRTEGRRLGWKEERKDRGDVRVERRRKGKSKAEREGSKERRKEESVEE